MSVIKDFRSSSDAYVTLENGKTALLIADSDFSGKDIVNKFGENPEIDTGTTPEDIIDISAVYPFQSTDQALEIFSNVADAGKTVTYEGVSKSGTTYIKITETIVLTGGVQALSETAIIVFRANQIGGTNINDIDIRIAGAGAVLARIRAGKGQTLMAVWAGITGELAKVKKFYATMIRSTSLGSANMRLVKRLIDGTEQTKFSFGITISQEFVYEYIGGVSIDPGEIIFIRCDLVTNNDTVISAGFDIRAVEEF